MVRIQVHNSNSRIVSGELPEQSLSFFTRHYKTKVRQRGSPFAKDVDKTAFLFELGTKSFPTGLIHKFEDYLKDVYKIEVQIEDARSRPRFGEAFNTNFEFDPDEHQHEAVAATELVDRGLIVIPTGGGKTYIAQLITAYKRTKTLFLVNSIDLLDQAKMSFEACFPDEQIGIIGKSIYDPQFITVATVQTLWARFKDPVVRTFLASIDLLLGDEIHHTRIAGKPPKKNPDQPFEKYPGNSFYSVIQAMDAMYRYGFSAQVPDEESLSRWFLESAIGKIIYKIDYKTLRDRGILADNRIFMVSTRPLAKHRSYETSYKVNIQNNEWVHELIANTAKFVSDLGYSSLLMVNRNHSRQKIETVTKKGKKKEEFILVDGHSAKLLAALEKLTDDFVFLTGKADSLTRENAIRDIKSKAVLIILGTLLKEGVDIPSLDITMFLCGGRAACKGGDSDSTKAIQAVGRTLRNSTRRVGGKRSAHVDVLYDDMGGMLYRHSLERIKAYKEQGYEVIRVSANQLEDALQEWLQNGRIVGQGM